jgi:superfamily I DNA/RNA helicase
VSTIESWTRSLYAAHGEALPSQNGDLTSWKRQLAVGASGFKAQGRMPQYDALFIDEAQDLLPEEIELLAQWTPVLFFTGDDRQRIYESTEGLSTVRRIVPSANERVLKFHYRLAPKICQVADRILLPQGGVSLESTALYKGPSPATVNIASAALSKDEQIQQTIEKLKEQIRVYADLIKQGDRIGVITARTEDRDDIYYALESDPVLTGKSKIIRAREDRADQYDPTFDPDVPICLLTVKGCKGLEFRAVHWLYADEISYYHNAEHYYTVVTRAKTSLDISFTTTLPQILARAHAQTGVAPW